MLLNIDTDTYLRWYFRSRSNGKKPSKIIDHPQTIGEHIKSGFTQDAAESIQYICSAHTKRISGAQKSKTEVFYKEILPHEW